MRLRWPWVSVGRLDELRAEIAWHRDREEALIGHIVRLARRSNGMAETPRLERSPPEPMPEDLREYIEGFSTAPMRRDMLRRANAEHRQGKPWPAIRQEILGPPVPEEANAT